MNNPANNAVSWMVGQLMPLQPNKPKPIHYWTYERCLKDSKRFQSRNQWSRNSRGAFQAAWRNGWMDDFIPAGGRK